MRPFSRLSPAVVLSAFALFFALGGSAFAVSESLHQLSWVVGGLAGLAMSLTSSGVAGLTVAAAGLAISLTLLLIERRRRILAARLAARPVAPQAAR